MLNKIAIIGLGAMGTSFVRYALPLCQTVLVYDNNAQQIETLHARMLNDTNPYDQHPALIELDACQKKIKSYSTLDEILHASPDLVVIATHKETHCEIALKALAAGAHVLVEKPIACNLAEANKMHAAAQANQKFLFVEFCLHKYSEFEYLAKIIKNADHIYPTKYKITRIAEIKDPSILNINASFDLQVHDVDFCLQTFGKPLKIEKHIPDARVSEMRWTYENGMEADLRGYFPAQHDVPFEYEFKCDFSDGSSLNYASLKNKDSRYLEKIDSNGMTTKIMLENYSAYQRVLEEVVHVIANATYHHLTHHPLLAAHAVAALELIS
jgi:predicted dehydrogenase